MKILILSSRFPYPIEKGDKLRLYHQMRMLSRKHELVLCSLHEEKISDQNFKEISKLCKRIYLFRILRIGIWRSIGKILFQGMPVSVAYFFRPNIKRKIRHCIEEEKPDLVFCQLIRMGSYLYPMERPVFLEYMDAFSMGMKRRSIFSPNWLRPLINWEAKRLRKFENAVFHRANCHSVIAQHDLDMFDQEFRSKVSIVPNGVDTAYFAQQPEKADFDLVFVGNLGYFPNIQAVRYLIRQITPLLLDRNPEVKILLAGARPSAEIQQLAEHPSIKLLGWVEDIREAYRRGKVFVAPLFTGSGQQNKILEAMSLGLPCITTPLVNEAIGAPANTLVEAEDETAFVEAIESLLNDSEKRKTMGTDAASFVRENFSWEAADLKLQSTWS